MPQAINTGDAMFAVAQLAMAELSQQGVSADITLHCLRRLNEMSLDLTKGQYLDMSFESQSAVTVEEYITMITGKTAVLISLACELGARIAGASEEIVAQYAQFGLDIGIAFQVCDDILGIWGHEAEIGKSAASDILTKKKSLPVLYGLAHSPELTAHYQLSAETPNFVATAITLLDQTNARAFAEQQAQQYTQSALTALDNARPQEAVKNALLQLTNQLLQRQS